MNEQTIEMQIHAKAQEALQSISKLASQLTGVEKNINNVGTAVNKVSTSNATKEMNSLNSSINKASNSMTKFKNLFTFVGVKRLTKTALGGMNEAVDYTEQLNLFNVVFDNVEKNGKTMFSNLGKEATKFQYKLNEAFGTNKTETLYMQGIFQSMGETVGIGDKYSAIMSETMTKLTYDLASLFNKSEKTTAEALRAGVYAAQTKPLRAYGIDTTYGSLQPIVDQLGIKNSNGEIKSVKEFSQAEKEILRYLATLKQAKIAMGDLANTIESPSNQTKIFRQQLVEAKVAMSSLFIGGLANILPYANAFLMVVKEVSKAIATMFGIELKDYNSGIASQEGIYDGITDSADDASKSVKELKRQTLGFDEIHNINEKKDSGSGTSTSGGIDQRLLDAIKGYDNGMDKVRMKASQIRDDIMKWLGFTKEIDPLTGEVSFKYQGIKTTLKNMWTSFKNLNTQGKIFVGLGLYLLMSKLFNSTKKLTTALGGSGLLSTTKKLFSPMKTLYNSLNDVNFANKSLTKGLAEGISEWSKSLSGVDKFKVSLTGVLGFTASMAGMSNAMKSVTTEGWNLSNSLQAIISGFGSIASGAYIGSIFGPWGTVIGGATSALVTFLDVYMKYPTEITRTNAKIEEITEKTNKYNESLKQQYQAIQENLSNNTALSVAHENLINELESIVDENGKIKAGYEERANFIVTTLNSAYGTEISIIDGKISRYKDELQNIKDIIVEKKKQIYLEASEEAYTVAIKEQAKTYKNYAQQREVYNKALENEQKAKENLTKAEADYNAETANGLMISKSLGLKLQKARKEYEETQKTLEKAKKGFDGATESYESNVTAILNYEGLLSASTSENVELANYYINKMGHSYNEGKKIIELTYAEQLNDAQEYHDAVIKITKANGQEITEEIKAQANSRLNAVTQDLINQSKTVEGLTPKVTQAWTVLAQTNKEAYNKALSQLPNDVRNQLNNLQYSVNSALGYGSKVYGVFGTVGANLGKTLGDGISNNMRINGYTLNSTWNSATEKISGKLQQLAGLGMAGLGISLRINGYANGGFPEDGWFRASHGELMGKFDNGKSVVASNMQITQGIEDAAYRGYMRAIAESGTNGGQASEIDVHVHTDEGTVIDRIEQRTKQTGQLPFTIPTY